MELFRTTPAALTAVQRWIVAVTAGAVALSRLWARSRSLWDWDESLFALAVRDYDVTLHHPHPPGFPLYIALAKGLRFFLSSDFQALQWIVTLAAIALFPLLFWLARELHFPFATAWSGSLLFVFLPDVWFLGGTSFSDVPAMALQLAASAALVRGFRSRSAFLWGALLLALGAAIRPQTLILGCAPALWASWSRIRQNRLRDVLLAIVIGAAVIAFSYGGAALASESVEGYLSAARGLREYVRNTDSFLSPGRPPLLSLLPAFFLRPIPGGRVIELLAALALISALASLPRRTPGVWLLVLMFLPFNILAWLMLDINSISRYAAGFGAMYALLAADGVAVVISMLWPTARPVMTAIVTALMTARLAVWTAPAIREVRDTISPPVASMIWIRAQVPPPGPVFIHGSMSPFATYFLDRYETVQIEDPAQLPLRAFASRDWFVTEGATAVVGGQNFVRARATLFDIARQRYFEVSAVPLTNLVRFGRGWYGSESVGTSEWRWMSGQSETLLPPLSGKARLTLIFDLPAELVPRCPTIEIRLNGELLDRFVCQNASIQGNWIVTARGDEWNRLQISIDKVLNPAREGINADGRDLGLELKAYSWSAAGTP